MLAFLRFIVSSLGLGENKWQVNVHLSLDSQYRIRLSGLCSSAQAEVQFTPTDRWFESRNECFFFDHLCNLTVFILEVISKLYDVWKLLLFRWAESNRFCEVSLEMMHTESSEQKDRTWLFELYLQSWSENLQNVCILCGPDGHCLQVALLTCYLVSTSHRWPLSYLLCCRVSCATLPFRSI